MRQFSSELVVACIGIVIILIAAISEGSSKGLAFLLGCSVLITSGLWAIARALKEKTRSHHSDNNH